MAKKQRVKFGEGHTARGRLGAELLGLKTPYGTALSIPNKYFLYINKNNAFMAVGFAEAYAARKFLDILLGDDEVSLTRGITNEEDTIVSSTGIRVRCSEIRELIDYEYSDREKQWQLCDTGSGGTESSAMAIRSSDYTGDEVGEKKTIKTDETLPKVVKAPKPSKDGLITIAQIAEEIKMEPKEARILLRKLKVEKPGCGWAWDKNKVDEIKKLLHDNKE